MNVLRPPTLRTPAPTCAGNTGGAPAPAAANPFTPAGFAQRPLGAVPVKAGSSKSATAAVGPRRGFPCAPFAPPGLAAHPSSDPTRHISVDPSLCTVMSEYPAFVRMAVGVAPRCLM